MNKEPETHPITGSRFRVCLSSKRDAMRRHVVHYIFEKRVTKAVGAETVEGESDLKATQTSEGHARKKCKRNGFDFLVTRIEGR